MRYALKIISIALVLATGVILYLLVQQLLEVQTIVADFQEQYGKDLIVLDTQQEALTWQIYALGGGLVLVVLSILFIRLPRKGEFDEERVINVDDEEVHIDPEIERLKAAQAYAASYDELSFPGLTNAQISEKILGKLANDFGAIAGVLYRRDGSGDTMSMTASFACNVSPEFSSFKIGEGLVGQAVQGNRIIQIGDIPEEVNDDDLLSIEAGSAPRPTTEESEELDVETGIKTEVESGLGTTIPKALVILPFAANGQAGSAAELGFFSPPNKDIFAKMEHVLPKVNALFSNDTDVNLLKENEA